MAGRGNPEPATLSSIANLIAFRPLGAPSDGAVMVISLVVGLVISLFQALTQIQEQTLTFVPKIVVMFVSLLVLLPFMLSTLITFTERLVDRIVSIG